MKRKLLMGVATATLAALALAGCSADNSAEPASNSEDGVIKVAAFSAGYATPPIKYAMDTFAERAEAQGWEVDIYTTNDDFDTLNGYLQQQLNAGYDAYFMTGVDPRPLATGLAQASEAGIPVFAIDADVQPNDVFTLNVASDQNDLAGLSVNELDVALGGLEGKNVAVVTFDPALSIAARTSLATDELTAAGANIVATHKVPNIAAAVDSTLAFVKDYVQANPGELDAIWSGLDPAAIGAFQGIVESGENIALVSSDAMGATVEMVASGGPFVASVKQDWSAAIDTLIGEMVIFFDDGGVSTNFISVPGELVTAENAGTVITHY